MYEALDECMSLGSLCTWVCRFGGLAVWVTLCSAQPKQDLI